MIHIFIGTKAQYIKTAPLLARLDQENISYNLIDSGQHAQITRDLRREFKLREPDVLLRKQSDITKVPEAIFWFFKYLFFATFTPDKIFNRVFKGRRGICLIHGDTLSTVLALFMAKRAGLKVAHIEAGLRSFNWFHPFPEEIVRVITMYFSDILFAPSDWAYSNLLKMGLRGKLVNLKNNINYESLLFSLGRIKQADETSSYCLVTLHRTETILIRKRLAFVIKLLLELARERRVLFIMHKPTKIALEKLRILSFLESNNIVLSDILPHGEFLAALKNADFVITDGGSIQEESFYLGVPCLLMRNRTERQEGLGGNVFLSDFQRSKIDYFFKEFKKFKTTPVQIKSELPSKIIFEEILSFSYQ
jgi:UDP-N-acetylglucosamine 2-epimerase